jgi:hypothetical protein
MVVLYDRTAHFDVFSVKNVSGGVAQIVNHGASTYPFATGSRVVQVESRTYYFDVASSQLRLYDGNKSDVPVADNVVSVSFDYFGDPAPPVSPKPPSGVANCLYDAAGQLLPLPALGPAGASVVPLPLAMLDDGPWCGSGATVFDADLLRVRGIRVTMRVQAPLAAFRANGSLFLKPGFSRTSGRYVPDLSTTFTVWPPNLTIRG